MYKHILLPIDEGVMTVNAVSHGVKLAKQLGARVTGLMATEPFHVFEIGQLALLGKKEHREFMEATAKKHLDKVTVAADREGVACETVHTEHDHPDQAIVDTAEALGCDLIVMAAHGRKGLERLLLGSTTNKVLTRAKIPVLVYRE